MPAVPGSSRRNSVGPSARPTSRANCQPRTISTTVVAIRTGVSYAAEQLVAVAVDDQDPDEHGTMTMAWIRARLTARTLSCRASPASRQE